MRARFFREKARDLALLVAQAMRVTVRRRLVADGDPRAGINYRRPQAQRRKDWRRGGR